MFAGVKCNSKHFYRKHQTSNIRYLEDYRGKYLLLPEKKQLAPENRSREDYFPFWESGYVSVC